MASGAGTVRLWWAWRKFRCRIGPAWSKQGRQGKKAASLDSLFKCTFLIVPVAFDITEIDTEIRCQAYNSRAHSGIPYTRRRPLQRCQTMAHYLGDTEVVWPRRDELQWFWGQGLGWGLLHQSSLLEMSRGYNLYGYSWCWMKGAESDDICKVREQASEMDLI